MSYLEELEELEELGTVDYQVMDRSGSYKNFYHGNPLNNNKEELTEVPEAIKILFESKIFSRGNHVLEYGSDTPPIVSDWLRDRGIKVYCFNPFIGNNGDGWKKGNVSKNLPEMEFDVSFTCFLLNRIPKYLEKHIVKSLKIRSKSSYHITKNIDIYTLVEKALVRKDRTVFPFYLNEYLGDPELVKDPNTIMDFCLFGVETLEGFQRIPDLESEDIQLLKRESEYKLYKG